MNEPVESIIVVDEAQIIYNAPHFGVFWDSIKTALHGETSSLRLVLFAAYGYGHAVQGDLTPIEVPERCCIGLDDLCFNLNETVEYFQKLLGAANIDLEDPVQSGSAIFWFTAGHPGICAKIGTILIDDYAGLCRSIGSRYKMTTRDVTTFLCTPAFQESIFKFRAFINFSKLSKSPYLAIVRQLFENRYLERNNQYLSEMLNDGIIKKGQDGKFYFFCPYAALYVKKLFLRSSSNEHEPESLYQFVMYTCMNMNSSTLKSSIGLSSNNILLERVWQMEFWRASSLILGPNSSASPDVGPYYGVRGYIDFVLLCHYQSPTGTYKHLWGIELVREGINLSEHLERFDPDEGRYAKMLKEMTDSVIVDFRRNEPKTVEPGVIYAVYDDDFSQFNLICSNEPRRTISLT